MLKNYLVIAWRNFLKYKYFSAINIFGLSLSMSVCLVLINLILTHYQYDTFHKKADQIYRVTTNNRGTNSFFGGTYATSPKPIGGELMQTESSVVSYTNISKDLELEVESPDKILKIKSLFADERFFEVFDFELSDGDRSTALASPNSMVLKEEKAMLLFPGGDAIGKTVEWRGMGTFEITGVMREPEKGTHMAFEALVSDVSIEGLVAKDKIPDPAVWENIWQNYNYLVLAEGASIEDLQRSIQALAEEHMELEEDHAGYDFGLQSLNDIVPGPLMSNELGFALPAYMLFFFGVLGVIVIVTASLNYTNLFIARSMGRLKEIGVRKVNGAPRRQIVLQFLTESVFMTFLSLLMAIVAYRYLLDRFNELVIFNQLKMTLEDIPEAYVLFVVFAMLLGVFTGMGPSMVLSRVQVISSLRNSVQGSSARKGFFKMGWGRRSLTGIQFGLSIILLLTVFILGDQARYYVESEYGFDEEHVFYVDLQTHDPEIIKQEFSSVSGVGEATLVSHHPAVGRSYGREARLQFEDEPFSLYTFGVDEGYVDVMGLELVAGKNFPQATTGQEKFILLNETAVRRFNFESNSAAIGETIIYGDSVRLMVTGVLKDYHWEPLMASIRPLGLRVTPDEYEYAYFRVNTTASGDLQKRIEEAWITFDPARDFAGGFLDEQLDELYQVFYDVRSILTLIGFLAVTITSLGFLGMVGYDLRTRTKEIGIRKVLGASFRSLLVTLGRGYVMMLTLVFLVALPAGILINNLWVSQMAYHAPIDFGNVAPATFIVLGTGIAALISQVLVRNHENPVKALRNE